MIYRYLAKTKETSSGLGNTPDTEKKVEYPESSESVMHLSEDFIDLNADEETRLLIGLLDDIHDCADIMQHRSLAI